MKKLFFLGAATLLISTGVIAQSSEPEKQVKTKKEIRANARQQIGANEQAPEIDQLMIRKQEKEQLRTQDPSGDPIMQKIRSRERIHQQDQIGDPVMKYTRSRDKIHQPALADGQVGRANRATARSYSPGTAAVKNRSGKSQAVNPPARVQGKTRGSAMQARPDAKMQGAANGIRAYRPATTRGSRAGR